MKNRKQFRLIQPSTKAFYREGRKLKGYTLFDFVHGYVYGRWPYLYIGVGTGEHPLARLVRPALDLFGKLFPPRQKPNSDKPAVTFADTYHGKVIPIETARQMVSIKEPIHIEDLEQVIPYSKARSIILQHPDHIIVLDCPCRSSRANPCLPLDVCLIVGEPFAGFVHDHQPERSRWITSQEADQILQAEHARGHVAHAFFKDAMLGRFYAICNCCSCCCGAMQAHRNGVPMLASSGYLAQVDPDLCIQCGTCTDFCPFDALSPDEFICKVDTEKCMGCGVCVDQCPQGALALVRDPAKGEPLVVV